VKDILLNSDEIYPQQTPEPVGSYCGNRSFVNACHGMSQLNLLH